MGRTSSNLLIHGKSLPGSNRTISYQMINTPFSNAIFKNKQGFILNSKTVPFDNDTWKYNPQLFCKDQYDDQYLYPIILIVNNLGSIYEFNKERLINGIITPFKKSIFRILSQIKNTEETNGRESRYY